MDESAQDRLRRIRERYNTPSLVRAFESRKRESKFNCFEEKLGKLQDQLEGFCSAKEKSDVVGQKGDIKSKLVERVLDENLVKVFSDRCESFEDLMRCTSTITAEQIPMIETASLYVVDRERGLCWTSFPCADERSLSEGVIGFVVHSGQVINSSTTLCVPIRNGTTVSGVMVVEKHNMLDDEEGRVPANFEPAELKFINQVCQVLALSLPGLLLAHKLDGEIEEQKKVVNEVETAKCALQETVLSQKNEVSVREVSLAKQSTTIQNLEQHLLEQDEKVEILKQDVSEQVLLLEERTSLLSAVRALFKNDTDPSNGLRNAVNLLVPVSGFKLCFLDEKQNETWYISEEDGSRRVMGRKTPAHLAATMGQTLFSMDGKTTQQLEDGECRQMCVPVGYNDEQTAILVLSDKADGSMFTKKDQSLIEHIGSEHVCSFLTIWSKQQRLQNTSDVLQANIKELQSELEATSAKLKSEFNELQQEKRSETERLEQLLSSLQEECDQSNKRNTELESDLAALERSHQEKLQLQDSSLADHSAKSKELLQAKIHLENDLRKLQNSFSQLESGKELLEGNLRQLRSVKISLETENTALEKSKVALECKNRKLEQSAKQLETDKKYLENQTRQLDSQVEQLQSRIRQLEGDHKRSVDVMREAFDLVNVTDETKLLERQLASIFNSSSAKVTFTDDNKCPLDDIVEEKKTDSSTIAAHSQGCSIKLQRGKEKPFLPAEQLALDHVVAPILSSPRYHRHHTDFMDEVKAQRKQGSKLEASFKNLHQMNKQIPDSPQNSQTEELEEPASVVVDIAARPLLVAGVDGYCALVDAMTRQVATVLNAQYSWICLLEENELHVTPPTSILSACQNFHKNPSLKAVVVPVQAGIEGMIVREGKEHVIVNDAENDTRLNIHLLEKVFGLSVADLKTLCGVPIRDIHNGSVIGAFIVAGKTESSFDDKDVETLNHLSASFLGPLTCLIEQHQDQAPPSEGISEDSEVLVPFLELELESERAMRCKLEQELELCRVDFDGVYGNCLKLLESNNHLKKQQSALLDELQEEVGFWKDNAQRITEAKKQQGEEYLKKEKSMRKRLLLFESRLVSSEKHKEKAVEARDDALKMVKTARDACSSAEDEVKTVHEKLSAALDEKALVEVDAKRKSDEYSTEREELRSQVQQLCGENEEILRREAELRSWNAQLEKEREYLVWERDSLYQDKQSITESHETLTVETKTLRDYCDKLKEKTNASILELERTKFELENSSKELSKSVELVEAKEKELGNLRDEHTRVKEASDQLSRENVELKMNKKKEVMELKMQCSSKDAENEQLRKVTSSLSNKIRSEKLLSSRLSTEKDKLDLDNERHLFALNQSKAEALKYREKNSNLLQERRCLMIEYDSMKANLEELKTSLCKVQNESLLQQVHLQEIGKKEESIPSPSKIDIKREGRKFSLSLSNGQTNTEISLDPAVNTSGATTATTKKKAPRKTRRKKKSTAIKTRRTMFY